MDTIRERIQSDSMVVAELKTNVIVSPPSNTGTPVQRGEISKLREATHLSSTRLVTNSSSSPS